MDDDAKPPKIDPAKVHARACKRFDATIGAQKEQRELALQARKFVDVPGAQWEGAYGDQFENSIKIEVNKTLRGVRKIETDYRQNRIVPDFRPAGGTSDNETADTLDGMHRADSYHFKAQQARDNAFSECVRGGFGAYRLTNVLADPLDKDIDEQRINPAMIITDADTCVYFDGNSKLYDKSDARFCFVLVPLTREAFEDEYEGSPSSWPDGVSRYTYDWYRPDTVTTAEYYEVEEVEAKILIFTHSVSGETQRHWADDIEEEVQSELTALGWQVKEQSRKRKRVHKYILSGSEVLEDLGYIAGSNIPIVPVYGNRSYVDGIERFTGHVQTKMDAQRLYNGRVSKLAEIDATAPTRRPIFAPEQVEGNLGALLASANIERHAYSVVNPLIDPVSGAIISAGPIGYIEPPDVPIVTGTLLQIANQDLTEDDQDSAEQVKANVSEESMDLAASRVDAKSGIYLDNMRQSVTREGEIYLDMAKEVYFEEGRTVETMTEDGDDGAAKLKEQVTDKTTGKNYVRNDIASGKYKVMVAVTEATATKRDKAVRSSLQLAEIAQTVGDTELAQAALITAVMNQSGEGTSDLQKFARRKALGIGLVEPTEDEQAQIAKTAEAEAQKPDPTMILTEAQAQALNASAAKDRKSAEKLDAEVALTEAKTLEVVNKLGIDPLRNVHSQDYPGNP